MEIKKEFDIDAYDISKVISEKEMKELCEDYGLEQVINLFTSDEILENIDTSEIIENVVRKYDFDVSAMLEEWLSFAGNSNIEDVIEWLKSYGYKVIE